LEKKIRKGRVFAVVLILALVFIYAVYLVAKLVQNPTNTFMVTNGKISQEESDIGYIIREETVVKGQNYKNGMVKIKNEGEKVAKGDSVFRYYSSGEEELKNKIAELDVEIQSLMQNEKSSFPSDVKLLESQIEKELAPESGIVSYRVDGLESVLTTENFTKFNKSFLQDLKLKTGQTVASNEEVGKIINNYQCYIVFNSNTNEAKNSKVGDTIKIRVQNSDTLKASVENIIDEDDESKTITVKITNDVEKLIAYRKISFDIIWWDAEGFRIPNEAIKEENGLSYVVRNRNGYYNKMLVKILKQNDEYCIVRQYKTEELEELGFTSSQIYSMRNIALYDEIVLNPTDEQMLQ